MCKKICLSVRAPQNRGSRGCHLAHTILCDNVSAPQQITDNLLCGLTLTVSGGCGEGVKKTISRRKEGLEKKMHAQRVRGGWAQTWDLPLASQESLAACHGGCLDRQAFPCL